MRVARCDTCGAPLRFREGESEVVCGYCQQTTSCSSVAASVDRRGRSGRETYAAGEAVLVEWGGRDWHGRVLEVVGPDRYRVHYDGYSSQWDEVLGADRLEPKGPESRLARPGLAMAVAVLIALMVPVIIAIATFRGNGRPADMPPPQLPETARPLRAAEGLAVGQAVFVRWRGRWYPAEIVSPAPDARYRIHYTGWSSSWDEDVETDRIRVP